MKTDTEGPNLPLVKQMFLQVAVRWMTKPKEDNKSLYLCGIVRFLLMKVGQCSFSCENLSILSFLFKLLYLLSKQLK